MPILTAKVCTSNAEQFPEILSLWMPPPARVLDLTWGRGVFWKNVDHFREAAINPTHTPGHYGREWMQHDYVVWANDIDPEKGDYHYDFGNLPKEWAKEFDVVVFDPPYKLTGTQNKRDTQYGNKSGGYRLVDDSYWRGLIEARGILRPGGIAIVKCMDQVVSGKNEWMHIFVYRIATESLGMDAEDLFILVRKAGRKQPHKKQVHANKNHSFWWVFRKS